MTMQTESKIFIGIGLLTLLAVVFAIFIFSKPTTPTKITQNELLTSSTHIKGNASASAYLVEFSDFQCPSCKTFQPILKNIMEKNSDNLTFAYRHFPLTKHPMAFKAAVAAEAAGKQGKFWEMHDLLFEHQDELSDDLFINLSRQLNLNQDQFMEDLASEVIKNKVTQDYSFGLQIGINATPTFFLNGEKMSFNTIDAFIKTVEQAAQKK